MISTSIEPNDNLKNLKKTTGLISKHAYCVLDVNKCQGKKFIKLKNPWGSVEWNGKFSNGSRYWTYEIRKKLNYFKNSNDGSFWMQMDDYLKYFTGISYSLPKEKNWKETNVYGKIGGYLDERSIKFDKRNVGCVPQWSIKFTQKTIVRITYNVAGPDSLYKIFLLNSHGYKVNSIDDNVEILYNMTGCSDVDGFEYAINDFKEPYTFFFIRKNAKSEPCYFRILIESPDQNFTIGKFDDDYISENWHSFSDIGSFSIPEFHFWDPHGSISLSTCKQWYIHFSDFEGIEETEIRFRIFKTTTKNPLYLFFAKTNNHLSYAFEDLQYREFHISSISDYEEIIIPLNNKDFKYNFKSNNKITFVFAIYRKEKSDEIDQFKFIILSKKNFKFGLIPEPNPEKNCVYTVKGRIINNKNTVNPYNGSLLSMKQCYLIFHNPTTLFIDFFSNNNDSKYHIILEKKDKYGEKINSINDESFYYDFIINENCSHDRAIWKIDDITKPYTLCVTRLPSETESTYKINIFGSMKYEIHDIIAKSPTTMIFAYKQMNFYQAMDQNIDLPDIEFFEQPKKFAPIKKEIQNNDILLSDNEYIECEYEYEYENSSSLFDIYSNEKSEKSFVSIANFEHDYIYQSELNNEYYSYEYEYEYEEENNNNKSFIYNKKSINQYDSKNIGEPKKQINNNGLQTWYINPNYIENQYDQLYSNFTILDALNYLKLNSKNYIDIVLIAKLDINPKNYYIYVLGDFEIMILKKKKNSKKIVIKSKINLNNISKIYNYSNYLEIQYKKKIIRFKAKNLNKLIDVLIKHINRTLNEIELKGIIYYNFGQCGLKFEYNSNSIFLRLNSLLTNKKIHLSKTKINIIYEIFFSHSNVISLKGMKNKFKARKLYKILFPCILMNQNIDQLNIRNPQKIIPFIIKNITFFKNIKHIKIFGEYSKCIDKLIELVKISKSINSISFVNTKLNSIIYLSNLIWNYKINSIGFTSINEKTFNLLTNNYSFRMLKYFRISNFSNFNLSKCFNNFFYLSALSLTSCNLQIGFVFKLIKNFYSLKYLDLSNNKGDGFLNYFQYSLPINLKELHINKVKWKVDQLAIFMNICSNSNLQILSINNIDFFYYTYMSWDSLFNRLPQKMNSIITFSWNSNKINYQFIEFLSLSPKLENVSFCFAYSSDLVHIKNLIIQKRIQTLNLKSIRFNGTYHRDEHFKKFIQDIPQMKSLMQIDLSYNMNNEYLNLLMNSLENSNINIISFDNSKVTSFSIVIDFLKHLIESKVDPINISYPIHDIQRFQISREKIDNLNNFICELKKPLSYRTTCRYKFFPEFSYLNLDINFPQFWS